LRVGDGDLQQPYWFLPLKKSQREQVKKQLKLLAPSVTTNQRSYPSDFLGVKDESI
jgi:hypothetical protein